MARRNKMSALKRQRERKKAEKAALKREQRLQRESTAESPPEDGGAPVASREDLEGYGVVVEPGGDAGKR